VGRWADLVTAAEADRVIAGRPYNEPGEVVTRRIMPKTDYDKIADRVTAKKYVQTIVETGLFRCAEPPLAFQAGFLPASRIALYANKNVERTEVLSGTACPRLFPLQ
jgi:hypothetical protein